MNIQLVRHATIWVEYAGAKFLIDPMFGEQASNPPIPNSGDERRNPLVPLPGAAEAWLAPDAVVVTHLHRDHWDEAAARALSKSLPVLCQPGDGETIRSAGFADVTEVEASANFRGVTIHRTGGQHGTGDIGRKMGQVSGFVFQAPGEPTLYIAGDTIWCDEVRAALDTHRPEMTIVNAGGARFVVGDAITMDDGDVAALIEYATYTRVVAIHMDTINHCRVTRDILRTRLAEKQLLHRIDIPEDGDPL